MDEAEIQKQKDRLEILEAAVNLSQIGFYITDGEGKVIILNDAHARVTGLLRHNTINRYTWELERENRHFSATTLVLNTKKPAQLEQFLANGRSYFVYAEPYFDADGNVKYVISNLIDTTEINLFKQELAKAEKDKSNMALTLNQLKDTTKTGTKLVYHSKKMHELIKKCEKIAPFDSTVLITGESGVGKELIADYIHEKSLRISKPFIKINCASIPENLLESELFGYEPGAFTSAKEKGKKGILEFADQGTIFLDEIGELPLALQAKLLRFLQEGEIFHIGGHMPIKSDVRVVAATNRDLEASTKKGEFRSDLYYRLNVISINVPTLEERKEDIPFLIHFFTKQYNEKYGLKREFAFSAIQYFMSLKLEGNVRELQNIVERVLLLAENDTIDMNQAMQLNEDNMNEAAYDDKDKSLKELLEEYEKTLLEKFLLEYKTAQKVGEVLSVSQPSISRKLHKYKITKENMSKNF